MPCAKHCCGRVVTRTRPLPLAAAQEAWAARVAAKQAGSLRGALAKGARPALLGWLGGEGTLRRGGREWTAKGQLDTLQPRALEHVLIRGSCCRAAPCHGSQPLGTAGQPLHARALQPVPCSLGHRDSPRGSWDGAGNWCFSQGVLGFGARLAWHLQTSLLVPSSTSPACQAGRELDPAVPTGSSGQ